MQRFQIIIEGTVKPDPDKIHLDSLDVLHEMKDAVEASFRPDLCWGVEMTSMDITFPQREEGDSDS